MTTAKLIAHLDNMPHNDWPAIWAAVFNATFDDITATPQIAKALQAQWSQAHINALINQLER